MCVSTGNAGTPKACAITTPVATQGGNLTDDDAQSGQIMDQWIEGDTNLSGAVQSRRNGDEPEARIFTIDRYTGTLKRVETQR